MVHLVVEADALLRLDVGALDSYGNVDVVRQPVVRFEDHRPRQDLAGVRRERRPQQQPALVPVRARSRRRRRQYHSFRRAVEVRVEPAPEAVDNGRFGDREAERHGEVPEVRRRTDAEVELVRRFIVRHGNLRRKIAHDGLAEVLVQRGLVKRREVDAVKVRRAPERRFRLLLLPELAVGDGLHENRPARRHHEAVGPQEAVARRDEGLEHALVDEEEAERLRDDDVDVLGDGHVLDFALDDVDARGGVERVPRGVGRKLRRREHDGAALFRGPVGRRVLGRVARQLSVAGRARERGGALGHGRRLDGVHAARAGLRGEEREDPGARADVQDDLPAEVVRVGGDGAAVRLRSYDVLQHILLVL
mmetsp:Transcript_36427/g.111673  ORF Transcript_36427/g.111673 Transcript_36427/m.111673 type:complete len:363 (-) Transcript_36427:304-1392(-)